VRPRTPRPRKNRIAFGRPKKVKTLQQRRKALEIERHEGHRLDRGEPEPDSST
jgi:hypothetical protein